MVKKTSAFSRGFFVYFESYLQQLQLHEHLLADFFFLEVAFLATALTLAFGINLVFIYLFIYLITFNAQIL